MREGARLALPPGKRPLLRVDFLRAHAGEEIVARVERANMVETEPAIRPRPLRAIARPLRRWRAELARGVATRLRTRPSRSFDPAVEAR